MSLLKRAYLHAVRKKGKTLLMLCVLLIMATLVMTCISIWSATDMAALNIRKTLSGSFTVNAKNLPGGLSEQNIADIKEIDGVKDDSNMRFYTFADYMSNDGEKLAIDKEGVTLTLEGFENSGKIVGTTNSQMDTYFTEAGFEIAEGMSITPETGSSCLVHEEFAEKNGLSIGDSLILQNPSYADLSAMVEIIGTFTNTKPQEMLHLTPSYDLYENIVFTDVKSASAVDYAGGMPHYEYGDFYPEDPEMLPVILEEITKISGLEDCTVTKYDADYQNTKSALVSLQNIVFIATVVIVIVGTLLLVLILSLWVRERIHEVGVFLAMGISKLNILAQQLTEILMIALIAFALSFGASALIAQSVGNGLMTSVHNSENVQVVNLTEEVEEEQEDTETPGIDVAVNFGDLIIVVIAGVAIILISVSCTSVPILRLKPKNILAKLD